MSDKKAKEEEAKEETKQTEEEKEDEEEDEDELEAQEFIFLIDRSGSMYWGDQGAAIKMAKRALEIFMHSLPDGSKFNICGYGTGFEFLF